MGMARRSTARLGGWLALAAVMAAALTVTAYALTRSSERPPKRPLAVAIHNALTAKDVSGVRAQFTISQHLIPGASSLLDGALLGGAHGTIWASGDRVRLVVRSQLGRVEAGFDGRAVTLYAPNRHAAYRVAVPHHGGDTASRNHGSPPSLADIRRTLSELGRTLDISGAVPGNVAGRPAYTVRISARHDSGLIGPLALAWDAAHGTPLRVALYPRGASQPAIELQVTHIRYGKLAAGDTAVRMPAGTHVTAVELPTRAELRHAVDNARSDGHSSAAPPSAAAPATAAGLPRTVARSFSRSGARGLLAVYGRGLGSVVVIERQASGEAAARSDGSLFPSIRINGARGSQLVTTLGTIVSFRRGGTEFVVLGARQPSTIIAVARALS